MLPQCYFSYEADCLHHQSDWISLHKLMCDRFCIPWYWDVLSSLLVPTGKTNPLSLSSLWLIRLLSAGYVFFVVLSCYFSHSIHTALKCVCDFFNFSGGTYLLLQGCEGTQSLSQNTTLGELAFFCWNNQSTIQLDHQEKLFQKKNKIILCLWVYLIWLFLDGSRAARVFIQKSSNLNAK